MDRKIVKLYFDIDGSAVTALGLELDSADRPVLFAGETLIVQCRLLLIGESDGALTTSVRALSALVTPRLTLVEKNAGAVLCAADYSADAAANRVNCPGDWDDGGTADPAQGQLSFRLFTDTAGCRAAAAAQDGGEEFELRVTGTLAGEDAPGVFGHCPATLETLPEFGVASPGEEPPEFFDYNRLLAVLRSPEESSFSGDGAEWHAEQTRNDLYFRLRRSACDWGSAVRLPPNAGFRIDCFGLFADRAVSEPDSTSGESSSGYSYYATDTELLYIYDGENWSDGVSLKSAPQLPPRSVDWQIAALPLYLDDTYGRVGRLDADTPTMNWVRRCEKLAAVRLRLVSANPAVSGAIVLQIRCDGEALDTRVIEFDGGEAVVRIPFTTGGIGVAGMISLERLTGDERDTLRDGATVSALVVRLGGEFFND